MCVVRTLVVPSWDRTGNLTSPTSSNLIQSVQESWNPRQAQGVREGIFGVIQIQGGYYDETLIMVRKEEIEN